jgi:hypothetical protein
MLPTRYQRPSNAIATPYQRPSHTPPITPPRGWNTPCVGTAGGSTLMTGVTIEPSPRMTCIANKVACGISLGMGETTCFGRAKRPQTLEKVLRTSGLMSSGSRDPVKQPRAVPIKVRAVLQMIAEGFEDENGDWHMPSFVEAAQRCDVAAHSVRQWLGRSEAQTILRKHRSAALHAAGAGNPEAMRRIRDTSPNAAARAAAGRLIEDAYSAETGGRLGSYSADANAAGVVINIVRATPAAPAGVTIEGHANAPALLRGVDDPLVYGSEPAPRPKPQTDDDNFPIFRMPE